MYAILRAHKRFEALRNFTLESGQEEIDRQKRHKKDRGGAVNETPGMTYELPSDPPATPSSPHPTSGSEYPAPPSQFEIGDDEDSDEEDKPKDQPSASSRDPVSSTVQSRTSSISSSVEEAVPLQLRAMSEKARGKLPEGAFQRQASTTSLASHVSGTGTATSMAGFTPSPSWVCLALYLRL